MDRTSKSTPPVELELKRSPRTGKVGEGNESHVTPARLSRPPPPQSVAYSLPWSAVGTPHGRTVLPTEEELRAHDMMMNSVAVTTTSLRSRDEDTSASR